MSEATAARLGILMLDTRFPRILGDVGNPATWPFPVRYQVVGGATPDEIVRGEVEPFVQAFIAAGQQLVSEGCSGIATTCGFLSLIRPRLAAALGVPVAASALEQTGMIRAMLGPEREVGILTISAKTLSPEHLQVAGVPTGSCVRGVDRTAFADTILNNRITLDVPLARDQLKAAAVAMVAERPGIGAILLECTNMVPYAPDIAQATGRPVYSIYTYLRWFHAGLAPHGFDSDRAERHSSKIPGCFPMKENG